MKEVAAISPTLRRTGLAARLAVHPDAERLRLRLGTAFVEHADAMWPAGDAPEAEWIRANVYAILAALDLMLRRDGRDVRRLPRRLHWLMWLLAEIDLSHLGGSDGGSPRIGSD